jgi:hypothetical protein
MTPLDSFLILIIAILVCMYIILYREKVQDNWVANEFIEHYKKSSEDWYSRYSEVNTTLIDLYTQGSKVGVSDDKIR